MNKEVKRGRDSALVRFVREGEGILDRVRQDVALRRALGVGSLLLASLLFIPTWFLIPGLVFTGFSLLSFNPFWFGMCGHKKAMRAKGGADETEA